MIGGLQRAATGKSALEILTGSPATLDDEIRRLVRQHGWEAVATAAKRLAKPNKRAEPEHEDFRALGPHLKEESRRLLQGEAPRTRTQLAELAAPFVQRNHSQSSVVRRLLRRLGSSKCARLQAILLMETAQQEFTCHELIKACRAGEKVVGAELLAHHYLRELNEAVEAVEEFGETVAASITYADLMAKATDARNKRGHRSLGSIFGLGAKTTDAN